MVNMARYEFKLSGSVKHSPMILQVLWTSSRLYMKPTSFIVVFERERERQTERERDIYIYRERI